MPQQSDQPVEPRTLGGTGLLASPITLGTSSLGAGTSPGGPEEAAAVELAQAMLHGPYALIDTSNNYAKGRSEAVLGLALASGGAAEGRSVVTKADQDPGSGAFNRDRVWRSFEESCQRLGVERLRLLHLHDPYSLPSTRRQHRPVRSKECLSSRTRSWSTPSVSPQGRSA